MKCKTCNSNHDGTYGSGKYCSRSCANSRGPRSKETKRKIKETNILRAKERGPEWKKMMQEINSNPDKIAKTKASWIKKRDFNTAHISSIKRWVKEDIEHCEVCGLDSWMGEKIPLEVHHLDGNITNNSRENLTVLCCNCHAQTDNWRGKKVC